MSEEPRSTFRIPTPSKKVVFVVLAVATLYHTCSILAVNYYGQLNQEEARNVVQDLPRTKSDLRQGNGLNREILEIQNERMNIVLLYADDWSFNTLGIMGNTAVKTPVLDRLAKSGMLFTHNCVVASVCMQSRATLYTGQYSSKHQTFFSWMNVTMYEPGRWNQTLYPLATKAGYHVGFFGKYHHLEPPPPDVPTFSEFKSYPYEHYVNRNNKNTHITEANEMDSLEFLEKRPRDKPFFLTTSFFATHAEDGSLHQYRPMESSSHLYQNETIPRPKTFTEQHWKDMPPFFNKLNEGRVRFRSRYNDPEMYQTMMKKTYRMATEVDAACGRIIDVLEKQGVADKTLIIFTTDNGNTHGQHGLSEKWYAYEDSLRVPLIIMDPRMPKEKAGTRNDDFTLNIDLAPTILSAAGITPPSVMQGSDIADLYLPRNSSLPWRQEFLYEFWNNHPGIPNSLALVQKGFKYIYWTDEKYHQAFDLEQDPLEENDLLKGEFDEKYSSVIRRVAELLSSAKNGLPL